MAIMMIVIREECTLHFIEHIPLGMHNGILSNRGLTHSNNLLVVLLERKLEIHSGLESEM